LTFCGESLALSVRVKAADAGLVVVGLNWMFTVQEAPGASGPVQLLHLENNPASGPVNAPMNFKVEVPLLVMVTCCAALAVFTGWLPKLSEVVERVTAGAMPVPDRVTDCGESLALSVRANAADAGPAAVGLNWMLTVQKAAGASGPVQSLHLEKDEASVPVSAPLKLSVEVPLLVMVTDCAALAVPATWLAKVRLLCERVTAGATPAPDRLTDCGESLALSVRVKAAEAGPVAVGLKAMLTVQEVPGASVPVQLLHLENMEALIPVMYPL
jgi:hypothetical protein